MAEETLQMDRKGLFDKSSHYEPPTSAQNDMTILNTRLRVSEERYTDLRRKMQLMEQNILSNQKKTQSDFKSLQTDMIEMKRQLREMQDRLIMTIKELQLTARKEDVDVMKRYVEMWDPVRFATMDQIDKIVDEKLGKHHEEMHEE